MPGLRALFIHGIGEQGSDFADEPRRWLRDVCRGRGVGFHAQSAHWAPLADAQQADFLKAVGAHGANRNTTQRLAVMTLADALLYQSNKSFRSQVFAELDNRVWLLGSGGFTIFAHSLGGLIAVDYLRARPEIKSIRMVTLGCNLGLFHLGQALSLPPALRKAHWLNLFSPRDMLGFPLSISPEMAHVKDVSVSVGGIFTGWTGLAHIRYWGDGRLWRKTIPGLLFG